MAGTFIIAFCSLVIVLYAQARFSARAIRHSRAGSRNWMAREVVLTRR